MTGKRGPGQPQIGTLVKATLRDEDLAAIDQLVSDGTYKTRSAAIRSLVTTGVDTQRLWGDITTAKGGHRVSNEHAAILVAQAYLSEWGACLRLDLLDAYDILVDAGHPMADELAPYVELERPLHPMYPFANVSRWAGASISASGATP